jgi:DnaK suppressor protein
LSKGFNAGPHLKSVSRRPLEESHGATIEVPKVVKSSPFLKKQKQRLLELRSMLLDSMESVADGSLRSRPEGSEASAFGQHMADAGSDAYDRDFALSLLSQEQDSLYEINEALKRLEIGTYGICEMSGKQILEIRLEALPFTRFTVECQAQLEREGMGGRHRRPVRSLFGLEGETDGDSDSDDEEETETVDNKQE